MRTRWDCGEVDVWVCVVERSIVHCQLWIRRQPATTADARVRPHTHTHTHAATATALRNALDSSAASETMKPNRPDKSKSKTLTEARWHNNDNSSKQKQMLWRGWKKPFSATTESLMSLHTRCDCFSHRASAEHSTHTHTAACAPSPVSGLEGGQQRMGTSGTLHCNVCRCNRKYVCSHLDYECKLSG